MQVIAAEHKVQNCVPTTQRKTLLSNILANFPTFDFQEPSHKALYLMQQISGSQDMPRDEQGQNRLPKVGRTAKDNHFLKLHTDPVIFHLSCDR